MCINWLCNYHCDQTYWCKELEILRTGNLRCSCLLLFLGASSYMCSVRAHVELIALKQLQIYTLSKVVQYGRDDL